MAAKDYVWGVKGINRIANKWKLTPLKVKRIIKEEIQAALDEKKKKKTKVSKIGQKRVSTKIGILISKEKMDPKQAAAVAYSMEKRGELKKGRKHSVGSTKKRNR
mgnify:CR=1 FL=1|tara:strand:+ start:209 stop:523 length:315 start_codon:yes stop_codon:yes gene_type:complete